MTSKYPRCHFCKQEMAEGNKLKTQISGRTTYICFNCTDIIAAIVHDFAVGVFVDISHIMNDPSETWKERLEMWQIEEDEAK